MIGMIKKTCSLMRAGAGAHIFGAGELLLLIAAWWRGREKKTDRHFEIFGIFFELRTVLVQVQVL
jgi:hypothetical protein